MTSYAFENATITEAKVYSDAALTTLVETLTVTNVATGEYLADLPLTYTLYSLNTPYYLKVTWSPSSGGSRYDVIRFKIMPAAQAAGAASTTTTDADGQHLQAPILSLRVGCGVFLESELTNLQVATRNRYEAIFPLPDSRTGKVIHFLIFNSRAGEPFSISKTILDVEVKGELKTGQ